MEASLVSEEEKWWMEQSGCLPKARVISVRAHEVMTHVWQIQIFKPPWKLRARWHVRCCRVGEMETCSRMYERFVCSSNLECLVDENHDHLYLPCDGRFTQKIAPFTSSITDILVGGVHWPEPDIGRIDLGYLGETLSLVCSIIVSFLSPLYFRLTYASSPSLPSNSLNTPAAPLSLPSSPDRKGKLYNSHSSFIQRKICR